MAVGPLVVYGLTAMSPMVVIDLGLSRAQFGAFAGVVFAVAMLSSVPAGQLVDRFGGRRVLFVLSGAGISSMVLATTGASYGSLLIAVGLSGVVVALGNPVTNQLVSLHVDAGRRGTTVGLKQGGVPLGQVIVGLMLPPIAVAMGWRVAMIALLAFPLVNVALALIFVPPKVRRGPSRVKPPASSSSPVPTTVWWLAAYSFLMGVPVQATNAYLPLFAHERLGLGLASAGLSLTIAGAVGLLARVYWGRIADRLASPPGLLILLALGSALGSLCLWGAGRTAGVALFWVAVTIHGAAAISATVVTAVVLVHSVAQSMVGRASGLLATGQFAGFALGPIVFGVLVDAENSYLLGWLCSALMYLAAGAMAAVWLRTTFLRGAVVAPTMTDSPLRQGGGHARDM